MLRLRHGRVILSALICLAQIALATAENDRVAELIRAIHQANAMDMELGQLAFAKGQNASVKDFGQQMVMNHKDSDAKLLQIAEKEKWTLPASTENYRDDWEKLNAKSGAEFDKAYIDLVSDQHVS